MRTCVTGGAGFIGRHVVNRLLAAGEDVRVLDLDPSGLPPAVEAVAGSVTDARAVAAAVEGCDAIIHLAANPFLWARDKAVFDEVNHQGTRNVLEACARAGVRKAVHVSSLTVLIGGPPCQAPRRVDETEVLPEDAMLGAYPLSKWRAEQAALEAVRGGLDVSIAIPTMPLGPGDAHLTSPTRLVLDFLTGRTPASVFCWMNLCDVRDMAAGIVALRHGGGRGERYILGGEDIGMPALLALLEDVSGEPMPHMRVPGWLAELAGQVDERISDFITHKPPRAPLTGVKLSRRQILFDSGKAKEALGFEPRPLRRTLEDLLDWFEAEGLWHYP